MTESVTYVVTKPEEWSNEKWEYVVEALEDAVVFASDEYDFENEEEEE